jgi:hypothetical protein
MSRPHFSAKHELPTPFNRFAPIGASMRGAVSSGVAALFLGQCAPLTRLLRDWRGQAAFNNLAGTTLYAPAMRVGAFMLRAG